MKPLSLFVGLGLLLLLPMALWAATGDVCPQPKKPCPGMNGKDFAPYELSFRLPSRMQWMNEYQSKPFYAVILQSKKAEPDDGPQHDKKCGGYFNERQRRATQKLFPGHKVFASRNGCSIAVAVYYTGANRDYNFLAVYAGQTKTEADKMLAKVKATGKYPGANLRRLRAGIFYGD